MFFAARALFALLGLAIGLIDPTAAHARGRWLWPLAGPVVARFHLSPDRFAAGQRRGIDIAAPSGTEVRAACPGTVTFAGRVPGRGRAVAVACGRLSATYLHLGALQVRRGERVIGGEGVGRLGDGSVLRLGARLRTNRFGYVDPLALLGAESGRRPGSPIRPPAPPAGPVPVAAPAPVSARSPVGPHADPALRPVRFPAPGAPVSRRPRQPALPLGAAWLPAGFALLIAGFAVESVRRVRRFRAESATTDDRRVLAPWRRRARESA
jgi:hypothetical protein